MICTDLDGTYLNNQGKVSDLSKNVWNQIVSAGFLVTVATARSPLFVSRVLENHTFSCPMVSLGGAVLFDPVQNKVLGRNSMRPDVVDELLVSAEKYELSPVLLDVRDDLTEVRQAIEHPSDDLQKFLMDKRRKPTFVEGYHAYDTSNNVLVVTFVGREKLLSEVFDETICIREAGQLSCVWERLAHNRVVLEFKSKNATKELGLAQLGEVSKFDIGSATVFGDTFDDIGMFSAAGLSIAVANADEVAKQCAHVVSQFTNDQDAVARYICSTL